MFFNRVHAGELLAQQLTAYKNKRNTLVAGLPRGGVVTASAIAKNLNLLLLALVIKKIKHPFQPELALGAVGPDNIVFYNQDLIKNIGLEPRDLAEALVIAKKAQKEAQAKFEIKKTSWEGKTVILVDDGAATGATVECAIFYLKKQKTAKIILAIPVAAKEIIDKLKSRVDKTLFLETPADFQAVGEFYETFTQVTDEEVINYLETRNV